MLLKLSCAGVAGAVLLPVAGLGVGVAQVVRGAVNTPEAVRELNKGRFWDQVTYHITTSATLMADLSLDMSKQCMSMATRMTAWPCTGVCTNRLARALSQTHAVVSACLCSF